MIDCTCLYRRLLAPAESTLGLNPATPICNPSLTGEGTGFLDFLEKFYSQLVLESICVHMFTILRTFDMLCNNAATGTPPLPLGFNPATWMLEVTGGSMATMVTAVEVDWPDIYAASALAAAQAARADQLVQEDLHAGTPALTMASEYAMPFNVQVDTYTCKHLCSDLIPDVCM